MASGEQFPLKGSINAPGKIWNSNFINQLGEAFSLLSKGGKSPSLSWKLYFLLVPNFLQILFLKKNIYLFDLFDCAGTSLQHAGPLVVA